MTAEPNAGGAGLYSPGDLMWRVNREAVLLLSGPRALLMQIAHPLVAAGVAEHSAFRSEPLKRLRGTLDAMLGMIYGPHEEARSCAARVSAIHERVHGRLSVDTPSFARGTPYSALDPALLFWVQATLIDSALMAYDCFVTPLCSDERRRLYLESKAMAPLLRLPTSELPESYDDFRGRVDDMLEGPVLAITDETRAIADAVMLPRARHLPRAFWRLCSVVPLGLLPASLRTRYGFAWTRAHERSFRIARRSLQLGLPLLPERLRILPRARRAERERETLASDSDIARRARRPS